jgi:hypothetical protein
MVKSEFTDDVDNIALYTDPLILACLSFVVLWVLIRLRFKVDRSGILTLLLHVISSILRILRSFLNIKVEPLVVVSGILIWISLYYFTFEMQFIKITLTSENY